MNLSPFKIVILITILITIFIELIIVSLNISEPLEIISDLAITDLIAILSITVYIVGTLLLFGAYIRQTLDYHLKASEFSTKEQILVIGGAYVSFAIYAILVISYDIPPFFFASFFVIMILFILCGYFLTEKYEIVTLKMVTFNEHGIKQIETRNNLKLYDTTDKDYRFKYRNKNEFIIPNDQVLEIIYLDKPNKVEEIPIENIGKKK